MKSFRILATVAVVLFALAMPSISSAQYPDERLNNFLSRHQDLREQLARNPSLIYDRQFRHEHPDLQKFMQDHPNVWGKLPDAGRYGAYDPGHHWHEVDWWHEHNPSWINQNHPEWFHDHPDWGHPPEHVGGYAHPDAGYGHPDAGYGHPDAGYGHPDAGYGHPETGYGHPVVEPHPMAVEPHPGSVGASEVHHQHEEQTHHN